MRKYITLTRKDTKIEKFFSAKYIGLVLLSMSIGYFVPLFLFSLLIRRNVIHVRSRLITFSITSSAIFAAWRAFIYVDNQFFENVSNKFVDKYRAQAILNGFEDYEISKLIPNKTDR